MNRLKKMSLTWMLTLIVLLLAGTTVFASSIADGIKPVEYTEEFKEYLNLSDEERATTIMPRVYEIPNTKYQVRNPLMLARNIGSSLESKFSLKDVIGKNVVVKDQGDTNTCWTFATLSSLETNMAMIYGNNKIYDFSERHMNYATSRNFANNTINIMGFNRNAEDYGNYYIAMAYLTNGMGAINEDEMPFEDNTDTISIGEIQNKNIASQIYDTIDFPSYQITDNTTQIKQQMKEHIKKYGSIAAMIYGATPFSDYYNNSTGALYCSNAQECQPNHGVSIIGWNDNYAVDNFNEGNRPTNPGAWIIKNSWGDKVEVSTLSEGKTLIFQNYPTECAQKGWLDASQIPDEFVKLFFEENGYIVEGNSIYFLYGNNGLIYISYEDVNIYTGLVGIIKSANGIDYDNLYQYNTHGIDDVFSINDSKIYLASIFDKKTSGSEYLTQVSIYAPETYTCKVYVNEKNANIDKNSISLVELEAGTSETFDAGYHTLEFLNPIEIKENQFAVVIEIEGTRQNNTMAALECNIPNTFYDGITIESKKCFATYGNYFDANEWIDLSTLSQLNATLLDGDNSIKAFTVSKIEDNSLNRIVITTPPTKTTYTEGDNFDKTGMVVTAYYNNDTSAIITDYEISNGTNLQPEQTSVTISCEDKTATQFITVEAKQNEPGEQLNTEDEEKPNTENEVKEQTQPENSDLNDIKCNVKGVKLHTYSDNSKKNYAIIDLEITNIQKISDNDSLEYYYYLSDKQGEQNISNWIKIDKSQIVGDTLSFTININDLENSPLSTSDVLYIYIKEIAIKGGNQSVAISAGTLVEVDQNIETYRNDTRIEVPTINHSNSEPDEVTVEDNTTASGTIPQTGVTSVTSIIIVIALLGVISYIRYYNLNKKMK